MLDICLTAPGSLPVGVSCPQQGLPRVPKEFQPLLQCNSIKQENLRSRSALLKLSDIEYSWRSMHLHSEQEKSFGLAEVVGKSVIVHSQDGNPGSLLLNIGITQQSIRHENSLQVNEIEAISTAFVYSTNQKTMDATLVASPMEARPKSLPKKRSARKTIKERDIFSKSYFHACENLLTMLVDKRSDKKLVLSLKRSSPRLAQMLTNFSVAIAGTGLAVMLFMFTKAINGRFFLSANRLLNVGCGFGLVWVSWAVNSLRDTIESVGGPSGKVRVRDEKIGRRLKKNINQIVFRAATMMVVVALRFA
ncbi:hypothetical protein EJ110_NYTH22503 [Nymphaea thermarum]|nr:hypothetical protein EJ110_NYTH22503 [Nymphaea thermarum]